MNNASQNEPISIQAAVIAAGATAPSPIQEAEALYQSLKSGAKNSLDIQVTELFKLARIFAINGQPKVKADIYETMIRGRELTADQLAIIDIDKADMKRRAGNPRDCLTEMAKIPPPEAKDVRAEWHRVKAQAHLLIFMKEGSIPDKDVAFSEQDDALRFALTSDMPVDKKLFFLEGSMGIIIDTQDYSRDMTNLKSSYLSMLGQVEEGAAKARAVMVWDFIVGEVAMFHQEFREATHAFLRVYLTAPSEQYKTPAAIRYLICANDGGGISRELAEPLVGHIRQNYGSIPQHAIYSGQMHHRLCEWYPELKQ